MLSNNDGRIELRNGGFYLWLVVVAALICATGSWATLRLFHRAAKTVGLQQVGWHFLTAVAAGSSIWCTHFIAMLAHEPGVPVGFDPVLTIGSLLIAISGALLGFLVATSRQSLMAPTIGGAIVGLAIAVMHYTGMMAYRVQGIVSWDTGYLVASVVLSVALSAVALHIAMRETFKGQQYVATSVLAIAIVALHFTGMTAFRVSPMLVKGSFSNPAALQTLALAVAGVALIIVGTGLSSYLIDDNVRAHSYERPRQLALNDSLTGLPNRTSFNDNVAKELAATSAEGGKLALIGIDLDRFKEINDSRGHAAGDEVLRILSERMIDLLREGEFVARLGGDEFAALVRLRNDADLGDFLSRLEVALFKPIRLDDIDVIPGASIGVAIYPDDADNMEVLINNADLAMYRAKADVTRAICFYEPAMDETVRARRILASELREAIRNDQLDIHFQVQTSITSGEIRVTRPCYAGNIRNTVLFPHLSSSLWPKKTASFCNWANGC